MTDWTGGLIEPVAPPAAGGGRVIRRDAPLCVVKDPKKARKLYGLPSTPTPWGLTPHQVLVMGHLADGLTNDEIGRAVGLHAKTVEIHVKNAYDRMQPHCPKAINRVRAALMWDRHTRIEEAQ